METASPKISIIIATYNAGSTLSRCLSSIRLQTFHDRELIIIDGKSKDDTMAIIEKNSDIVSYWQSKRDSGIYDAWNQGIERSCGDYICFIGADDYFYNQSALSDILLAANDTKFDLITSRGFFLSSERNHHLIGNPWNYDKLKKSIYVSHPGLLHHRSLFQKYGNFDASLKIAGDYEFLLRLPDTMKTFDYPAPIVAISDGGISRSQFRMMLQEKKLVQSRCHRIGPLRAELNYYNKLWKAPIARALGISY